MAPQAVIKSLVHVWKTLESLDLEMAIMGGIAVSAWKHVRATRDVDLLIALDDSEFEPVNRALMSARVQPKLGRSGIALGPLHLHQFLFQPPGELAEVQIDLLVGASNRIRAMLARRVPLHLAAADLDVAVLSCEDLIVFKLLAGRIIDRVDVAELLRQNADSLDREYLAECSREFPIGPQLNEIWIEALPGVPPPA